MISFNGRKPAILTLYPEDVYCLPPVIPDAILALQLGSDIPYLLTRTGLTPFTGSLCLS
ncbi:MAG: hypothetical protein GX235_03525 [Clostridiales bacterium]|nr:hypothetical protein [Clostridiales bacterium]